MWFSTHEHPFLHADHPTPTVNFMNGSLGTSGPAIHRGTPESALHHGIALHSSAVTANPTQSPLSRLVLFGAGELQIEPSERCGDDGDVSDARLGQAVALQLRRARRGLQHRLIRQHEPRERGPSGDEQPRGRLVRRAAALERDARAVGAGDEQRAEVREVQRRCGEELVRRAGHHHRVGDGGRGRCGAGKEPREKGRKVHHDVRLDDRGDRGKVHDVRHVEAHRGSASETERGRETFVLRSVF
ncbi:hypothetical protein DFJ74DRAFT_747357, partial [Hyaloraphidium curvatum]